QTRRVRSNPLTAHDVSGLQPLRSLGYFELDSLALLERSEPVAINGGIMDENFLPILHCDEPVPLLRAEPFDSAGSSHFPRTSLKRPLLIAGPAVTLTTPAATAGIQVTPAHIPYAAWENKTLVPD